MKVPSVKAALITVVVSLALTGCTSTSSPRSPTTTTVASTNPSPYREAPLLATKVRAGALPAVRQRLPQDPMLVQPLNQVGRYGGVWHMAMVVKENNLLQRVVGYENLVRWDPTWTRVIPNVAQSYTASPDWRTFTFRLRRGMRWSDGRPFTADDIVFWYRAVFLCDDLQSLVEPSIKVPKDKLTVTKSDDYTVTFRFTDPQGLFLQRLAGVKGAFATNLPRHYVMQFHRDYNPDIARLVAQEHVANWVELFKKKTWRDVAILPFSFNPQFPTLFAWTLDPGAFDADGHPSAVVRATRNPYYWKIDTDYQQLPYIDRLEIQVVRNASDILPLVRDGRIDMQDRNIPAEALQPQVRAEGGYGVYKLASTFSNYMAISFNETAKDAVKRQIFRNKDFRIGLSYAINRPAIIRAAGLDAEPAQVAPLPGTPFYNETLATQYLDYDVGKANAYLDRAGYSRRDPAGLRIGPDGRPISFTMLVPTPVPAGDFTVHAPMIRAQWRAVGIDMKLELVNRNNADKRWAANDYDVTAFTGAGGFDAVLSPRHYVPYETFWSQQGVPWAYWALDHNDPRAQEPPPAVRETISLYEQIRRTGDQDRQNALMARILAIAADEFQVIGIHRDPLGYGLVKPSFHNVPPLMFSAANYPNPAPTNPCQYFIDPQT